MGELRVIKRYPNRKLYDTVRSKYITLKDVALLVEEGVDVQIVDNDTDEDITGLTLAQILLDAEKRKKRTLPLSALKGLLQRGETFIQKKITEPVVTMKTEAERTVTGLKGEAERRLHTIRDKSGFEDVRRTLQELVQQTQQSLEELQGRVEERFGHIIPGMARDGEGSDGLVAKDPAGLLARVAALESRVGKLEALHRLEGSSDPEGANDTPEGAA